MKLNTKSTLVKSERESELETETFVNRLASSFASDIFIDVLCRNFFSIFKITKTFYEKSPRVKLKYQNLDKNDHYRLFMIY